MRVLIVDDSVVFRSQITAALSNQAGIEVVGSAPNGSIALQKLDQQSIDLITLDMEMPDMDGIQVLKEIRNRKHPVKVIVFSSQTTRGAERGLEALREGAVDIVAKPSGSLPTGSTPADGIRTVLVPKILQFLNQEAPRVTEPIKPSAKAGPSLYPKKDLESFKPKIIVIASSTGGPSALEKLFSDIKGPLSVPILIAQHMPPVFTQILSKRIQDVSGIHCREALHGEPILPNRIYVAPGGNHLTVVQEDNQTKASLNQGPLRNSVRPAADYLFETAADLFPSQCLGIVLTGMGEDGLQGSKRIKEKGGAILIQDRASCVVFGMPGAVYSAQIFDEMGDLESIQNRVKKLAIR